MRLYQRKRGGVWSYDFTWNGQRVRDTTVYTNKHLAELEAGKALRTAQDNGVEALLQKAPVLETFALEFVKWVEATHSIKEDARRYYLNGWRMLKDTSIARTKMDKIANHDCETLTFPGGPASANCAIRTLRKMYSKAKEMKLFYGERPQFELREERARSIQMTWADAELIDSHWEPGEESQNSRDIFRLLCSTGMRPKECFEMRWEYWQGSVYCNPDGKTESAQRGVLLNLPPFNPVEVLKARHERMGAPKDGWIFPSPKAKDGHMVTINKPFTKARNRAGLSPKMVLYTARHGACTAMAEVTTLKDAMQLMGHSDIKTALRYQHPDSKGVGEKLWDRMKTQKENDGEFLKKVGVKL